jgi:lipopolysaccharide transport system ATP-binding protein
MTPPTVIPVESLSKVYRLGQIGGRTLSEGLNRWWACVRGKQGPTSRSARGSSGAACGRSSTPDDEVMMEAEAT